MHLVDSASAALAAPPAVARSVGERRHALLAIFGSTSIVIGVLWDISWHSTIGRDTFWTPAHLAIYLGGVLAGLSSLWLILKATFRTSGEERDASVRVWGFRGPLGAWVSGWGALAMLTSAPFDDWWHNAYGLDVMILSPPHTVLAAGMMAVSVGALLLSLRVQNQEARGRAWGGFPAAYCAGILLAQAAIFLTEHSVPNQQHASFFYLFSSAVYPVYLTAAARACRLRWPATATSAVYAGLILVMLWILPLFPARPLLAPIYNHVDHMVPPAFPLLLVVPAAAIDLLLGWSRRARPRGGDWIVTPVLGAAFLGLFLPAQWLFSEFLISPSAGNSLFAGGRFYPYDQPLGDLTTRFWGVRQDPLTFWGLETALLLAVLSTRVGLWIGTFLARVQR
jgi:hypothetical protein